MERTVLVTGAGSGIGLATAVEAARLGFRAVAAVHRAEQADDVRGAAAVAGVEVEVDQLDVTDDARAVEVVDAWRPWGLVNAAGLMLPGPVAETPPEDARRHLEVMVLAPVRLTQLALPWMRRQGGGRVVNVSSIAGHVEAPLLGWYEAAKQALNTLSEALRPEVARYGVDVVIVEPGPFRTPIWDEARDHVRRRRAEAVEPDLYDRTLDVLEAMASLAGDHRDVARRIGDVLHAGRPRFRYRVGAGTNLLGALDRVVPTSIKNQINQTIKI